MIRNELRQQLRRPRTYLTYAALIAFAVALTVSLVVTGADRVERVGDIPLYLAPSTSGFSVAVIALASTMKFFLPLAVAVFAGELVAGDAASGTLRYVLAGPGSRSRYLASKLAVAGALSLMAVLILAVSSLAIGVIAFGWHPLTVVDGSTAGADLGLGATYATGDALATLAMATAYVAAGMTSVIAFAFLLSTLTRNPFAAVAGGVSLTMLSRLINGDYLPGVAVLSSYMPNNDIDLWQHLFQQPAQTDGMARFLALQAGYVAVFLGAAWWRFSRRDVLV